jgi:hypothetical protein
MQARIKVGAATRDHKATLAAFGYEVETITEGTDTYLVINTDAVVEGSEEAPIDISTPELAAVAVKELIAKKALWTYKTWFKGQKATQQGYFNGCQILRELGKASCLVAKVRKVAKKAATGNRLDVLLGLAAKKAEAPVAALEATPEPAEAAPAQAEAAPEAGVAEETPATA